MCFKVVATAPPDALATITKNSLSLALFAVQVIVN